MIINVILVLPSANELEPERGGEQGGPLHAEGRRAVLPQRGQMLRQHLSGMVKIHVCHEIETKTETATRREIE